MSRLQRYILAPGQMNEASYGGNLGFEELTSFYKNASSAEKKAMDKILDDEDWESFKELIRKVVGTKLK